MNGNINKENFGYLGLDYQLRLIAQFLTDKQFANSIMDIVNPNYFEDDHLRVIVNEVKEAYETDEIIPDFASLEFRLMNRIDDEIARGFIKTQLRTIKDSTLVCFAFHVYMSLMKTVKEISDVESAELKWVY